MMGDGAGMRLVLVRDMVLGATIGVYPHEEHGKQRVRVNVELATEETGVGEDRLDRVLNYELVVERVRAIVGAGHVRLVETLAERIAAACLEDGRVLRARGAGGEVGRVRRYRGGGGGGGALQIVHGR